VSQVSKPRGRPRTGRAIPAAERARRYRVRLRERGIRIKAAHTSHPILAQVRFSRDTFLTPGEQDVLRRFCARLGDLPRLPQRVAVFGSRARGDSHTDSDLDVAVFLDVARDRETEAQLSIAAELAARPYRAGGYGIYLRPVPLCESADAAFIEGIRPEMETIWTAPK
jgi:hypothetical protein